MSLMMSLLQFLVAMYFLLSRTRLTGSARPLHKLLGYTVFYGGLATVMVRFPLLLMECLLMECLSHAAEHRWSKPVPNIYFYFMQCT